MWQLLQLTFLLPSSVHTLDMTEEITGTILKQVQNIIMVHGTQKLHIAVVVALMLVLVSVWNFEKDE